MHNGSSRPCCRSAKAGALFISLRQRCVGNKIRFHHLVCQTVSEQWQSVKTFERIVPEHTPYFGIFVATAKFHHHAQESEGCGWCFGSSREILNWYKKLNKEVRSKDKYFGTEQQILGVKTPQHELVDVGRSELFGFLLQRQQSRLFSDCMSAFQWDSSRISCSAFYKKRRKWAFQITVICMSYYQFGAIHWRNWVSR